MTVPSQPASIHPLAWGRERTEWLLLAAALALVGSLAAYALFKDRHNITAQESDRLQVQARVIDENLQRQFDGLNKALAGVRDDFPVDAVTPTMLEATSRRLAALNDALPGTRAMLVLDAKGVVLAASRADLVGKTFAEREYFTTPRQHPDPAPLYVSRPFATQGGVWMLNVSKAMTDGRGQFAGIVTAGLDPDYFNVVLRSVLYAPDMRATLVHGDGAIFLTNPLTPAMMGVDVAHPGSFFRRHLDSGQPATLFTGRTYATGENRMVASRTVRGALPLDKAPTVHVGRELAALYASWNREALAWGGAWLLLAGGGALALALAQKRRRVLERVTASAAQEKIDNERRLRAITDHLPALISHFDRDERCTFCNPYCGELYGVDHLSLIGRSLLEVRGPDEYAKLEPQIQRVLAGERVSFENRTQVNGAERTLQQNYVPDLAPDGSVQGFYSVSFDVTALKQVQQQLAALARVDPLTGLPNRRLLDEKLPEALARGRRDGRPMALLLLDVDHFKDINDTHGHATGDAVLQQFAHRVQQCVRATDTVARLAGDEFVIILEGLRAPAEAEAVAGKIVAALVPRFPLDRGSMAISSSIGIAFVEGEAVAAEELLSRADEALYRAKRAGRNTFASAA